MRHSRINYIFINALHSYEKKCGGKIQTQMNKFCKNKDIELFYDVIDGKEIFTGATRSRWNAIYYPLNQLMPKYRKKGLPLRPEQLKAMVEYIRTSKPTDFVLQSNH